MGKPERTNGGVVPFAGEAYRKRYYSRLYRKFVWITLVCSLGPLLLVGWGINIHYTRFARERMMKAFKAEVGHHRTAIELFLKKRTSSLHLIAQTQSVDYLRDRQNLQHVFTIMNSEYVSTLTDLGVIDEDGKHLAYVGPYDLMDKDYSETFWFREVMEKGIYVSDMFTGFRQVPHFIIAVTRNEEGRRWILRATIDTEAFRRLVEDVAIGKTGEVFLANQEGILQTSSRLGGQVMEKAPIPLEPIEEGIGIRVLDEKEMDSGYPYTGRFVVAQTWLEEPRWALVVMQKYGEAFSDVNHTNYVTLLFLHLSALTILIVSILTTRHLVRVIKNQDREADQLNQQLMQASKLASIGELSAGVAHEINNPLAIVLTERQILLDMEKKTPGLDGEFREQLSDSLSQIDVQVQRCKRITQNLLRFSRRTKSVIEPVDLNEFLQEIVDLLEREARTSGIRFLTRFEQGLPAILSDPSQLQQLFLNLITNAIDAHDERSYGRIDIMTAGDASRQGNRVTIADTGCGIPPENLDKIFDPFFTTKAVGKGTGLGLSICFSIVERLGGKITVRSKVGEGTEFAVFLPFEPPSHRKETRAQS